MSKKDDKRTADLLRDKLSADNASELPQELSRESIVRYLEKNAVTSAYEQTPFKKGKDENRFMKRITALAAAFVVLAAATIAMSLDGKGFPISMPKPEDTTAGSSSPAGLTEVSELDVTDAQGETVTDESGNTVTQKVTVPSTAPAKQSSVKIQALDSYDKLVAHFNKVIKESNSGDPVRGWGGLKTDTSAATAEEKLVMNDSVAFDIAAGDEYGKTNLQVEGVDEADIIKNDGKYIYYISNNALYIFSTSPAESMKKLSETKIVSGNDGWIYDMYKYKNYLSINYTSYGKGNDRATSQVRIYDVSDPAKPVLKHTFEQDGEYLTSRMIGGRIYTVSTYYLYTGSIEYKNNTVTAQDIVPRVYVDGGKGVSLPASSICMIPEDSTTSYSVIGCVDLNNLEAGAKTKAILGGGNNSYCAADALYISRQVYDYKSGSSGTRNDIMWVGTTTTDIFRFDLTANGAEYVCSGNVNGYALNQFSMDEYNGYFRIATTDNRKTDGEEINLITVLDKNLKTVGTLGDIAKGEVIKSVRFIKSKGYVVTFEQTDPLFVIDLSNPAAPAILGELKIPGFSSYLHPIDDRYILGVGTDGDENGAKNGVKLSLFDISNPASPKEVDKYTIENSYTSIGSDHKSVMYYKSRNLFGVPIYTDIISEGYGNTLGRFFVFKVENGKITKQGIYSNLDDSELADFSNSYFYNDPYSIRRGTYIGSTLYTVSQARIFAFSLDSGAKLGGLTFEDIKSEKGPKYGIMTEPYMIID